jgi:hypothetical protein
MFDLFKLIARVPRSVFWTLASLEAEILVLRHQLMILQRTVAPRRRRGVIDRLIFVWLYRLRPCVLDAVSIACAATVVRWPNTWRAVEVGRAKTGR